MACAATAGGTGWASGRTREKARGIDHDGLGQVICKEVRAELQDAREHEETWQVQLIGGEAAQVIDLECASP